MGSSTQRIHAFLMFDGNAEEAMNFYTAIFSESEIKSIFHQEDGTVMHAVFSIKGLDMMCIDSTVRHEFTFTPAISLFVTCDTAEEIEHVFDILSQDGIVLMPLAPSPVSEQFGWVEDKFGVSWQLNFEKAN